MRILFLSSFFPPDTGSASHLFYELASALVKRGHQVTVITSMPSYHPSGDLRVYRRKLFRREQFNGIDVLRVAIPCLRRDTRIGRGLWQFLSAAMFFLCGILIRRRDVSLVYSPPLPLGLAAHGIALLRGTPFLLNVQDLFPRSAMDLGLLKNKHLIAFFESLEKFLYRRAAIVTVHSEGNLRHVVSLAGGRENVQVMENWIDTDFLVPMEKENALRKELHLENKFIASFAGVLGYSQDLDIILDAAERLRSYSDIQFLIVGDGVEKDRIEKRAAAMALPNVCFLPMQSREKYPSVLAASDVCLVTLRADVKTPVVPSKIISAMAAQRPVIAALDPSGDAPELIRAAGCGVACNPGDPGAFANAILLLRDHADQREEAGRSGRQFAERHLSLSSAAQRYEQLLEEVHGISQKALSPAKVI